VRPAARPCRRRGRISESASGESGQALRANRESSGLRQCRSFSRDRGHIGHGPHRVTPRP
jgi:hypothetical protein